MNPLCFYKIYNKIKYLKTYIIGVIYLGEIYDFMLFTVGLISLDPVLFLFEKVLNFFNSDSALTFKSRDLISEVVVLTSIV